MVKPLRYRNYHDTEAIMIMTGVMLASESDCLQKSDRDTCSRIYQDFRRTWDRDKYIAVGPATARYLASLNQRVLPLGSRGKL